MAETLIHVTSLNSQNDPDLVRATPSPSLTRSITITMRFDNTARMQQLDEILKSQKPRKCKASTGRSIGSTGKNSKNEDEGGSRASSQNSSGRCKNKGKHTDDVLSDASTARNTTSSVSRGSICSRDSLSLQSRRSMGRRQCSIGCKQIVLLQNSWGKLKASQINETDIGENILFRLIETKAWAASKSVSTMKNFRPDRIDDFAKLFVETIDSIVSLAGPNLFEENFENLRLVWIDEGLHPALVSSVLLDGLRDSTTQDIFSNNVLQVWSSTVVQLLKSWEVNN